MTCPRPFNLAPALTSLSVPQAHPGRAGLGRAQLVTGRFLLSFVRYLAAVAISTQLSGKHYCSHSIAGEAEVQTGGDCQQ